MLKRKRGRPSTSTSNAPQRPVKRVRVGETSVIGTRSSTQVTEPARPMKVSATKSNTSPVHGKDRNTRSTTATRPASKAPVSGQSSVVKKRKPASKLFGKRRSSAAVQREVETNILPDEGKRRGRPQRANTITKPTTSSEAASGTKKGRGRPRKATKSTRSAKLSSSAAKDKAYIQQSKDAKLEMKGGEDIPLYEIDEDDETEASESGQQYWLMKAEPESRIENGVDVKFSIDDLKAKAGSEAWDGVRNHAARNNMRAMRVGDLAFFYHSNCKVPGIVGVMQIVEEHSVDDTAFDPTHPYYDAKSTMDKPKWDIVRVEFVHKFPQIIKLSELRSFAKPNGALETMQMLRQGRLSVSAVKPREWMFILGLAGEAGQMEDGVHDAGESNIDAIGSETVKEDANEAKMPTASEIQGEGEGSNDASGGTRRNETNGVDEKVGANTVANI